LIETKILDRKFYNEYIKIIDKFICELNFRFKEENIRPLCVIHQLITNKDLDLNLQYEYELRIYKKEISFDRLQNDLNVWYLYKKINNA
jgi:hypothetical protein